jgi:hypothetical protein
VSSLPSGTWPIWTGCYHAKRKVSTHSHLSTHEISDGRTRLVRQCRACHWDETPCSLVDCYQHLCQLAVSSHSKKYFSEDGDWWRVTSVSGESAPSIFSVKVTFMKMESGRALPTFDMNGLRFKAVRRSQLFNFIQSVITIAVLNLVPDTM